MRIMIKLILFFAALLLASCNDMKDVPREPWNNNLNNDTSAGAVRQLLVLNEGLFNLNNSTLARINIESQEIDYDYFKSVNKRGLGDTGNDMKLYGGKVYIVVNVSSQLEIIDPHSGVSLKQIPFFNEDGVARQPRFLAFDKGKAYLSSFDGWVARIDTLTLEVDGWVKCGRNPDNITIANNKLYVSNSGGLDNPNYDTTVSVVDLGTFREIKRIEVGRNPGAIVADSQGDVYVVVRGDVAESQYVLKKIDSDIDEVITVFDDIHPLELHICNDMMYMYTYNYTTKESWLKVFDCLSETVVNHNFISDSTGIQTPFGITVNPHNGDVYITEAYNYVNWGDLLCFDRNGRLKFRIDEIGLNPTEVLLLN